MYFNLKLSGRIFVYFQFTLVFVLFLFLSCFVFWEVAFAQERIYVTVGTHVENFTNPVKAAQKTRQLVELCNKYGIKCSMDISAWVSEEFQKCDPSLIGLIRKSRMPLTGTQENHLSFQIERTRGKTWDEGIANILAYQTQHLNKLTGISDPSRPGGWFTWEKIWGTSTMIPGNGTGFGGEMALYVERQLKATGAQINGKPYEPSPQPRPEIQGGIALSYGNPNFMPEECINNPDSYYTYDVPNALPQRTPVDDLKFMMNKYKVSSIRIFFHLDHVYAWHTNPAHWFTAYFAGGRPTVLYAPPFFPKWKEDETWKRLVDLIDFICTNPDKFLVVNRDMEENQWKAKLPTASRDMSKFPWIPPEKSTLSKSIYIRAAEQVAQRAGALSTSFTVDGINLSRSELFSAFVDALSYYERSKTLPRSVTAINLIGPVDLPRSSNGSSGRAQVSGESVIERAAELSRIVKDRVPARMLEFKPIGIKEKSNIKVDPSTIPLWVDSPDATELKINAVVQANPASFLHMMAEVINDINRSGSPQIVTYWQIPVVLFQNNLRFVDGPEKAQMFTVNEGKFYNVQTEVLSRRWIDYVFNSWTRKPERIR